MNLNLENKIALVTAATSGLGFATALELAKEGAKVMICGRNETKLTESIKLLKASAKISDNIHGAIADITQVEDIEKLVANTISTFNGLDILITNASGPPSGTFESVDLASYEKGFQLTLMSAVNLIHTALPFIKKSTVGSILTITSLSVKQPISGLILSNVFRPAVVGLTKTLSQELGPLNIRVNSILPGWTSTDRTQELLSVRAQKNGTNLKTEIEKIAADIPLKRIGRPEEFGKVAAFLVSPAASYVSGTMIQVDGGNYAGLL